MKRSKGERIFQVFNYLFLIGLALIFLVPFLSLLATSFVSQEEFVRRGPFILFPESLDFTAYQIIFDRGSIILNAYMVTTFRIVVGTFLNLLFTATLAYGLARKDLPGVNVFVTLIFISMIFSGGLIPTYVLVDNLGLTNSVWAMVLPILVNPFYFFIMRIFFMNLPKEIEESAIIDGATPPKILLKIIIPLTIPTFVTIGLFYAVLHWNSWFDAAIYITDTNKMPIQTIMRNIILAGSIQDAQIEVSQDIMPPAQSLRSAVIIVSTIPIMCIYPFIQKYFVKGVAVGAVKG